MVRITTTIGNNNDGKNNDFNGVTTMIYINDPDLIGPMPPHYLVTYRL